MNEYELCGLLGIFLFLLRRTDFVYWYARQAGIVDSKYLKARKEGGNFLDWLNSKHDNFYTEWLICPFCQATWYAIVPSVAFEWHRYPYYWGAILGIYFLLALYKSTLTKIG